MQIPSGHGYFELTDSHVVPGWPHISMDAEGKPFAVLYFGTKAEALEESAASWITNAARAASASSAELSDLREARAKLAELRVSYGENHTVVQRALARVREFEGMTKEELDAPADSREAKAHLAELRVDYGEQTLTVQRALARVKELEQMSKEEPNASTELREAKAHLAELRVDYSEQSSPVQKALAEIKALEQNVVAPAETSPTLAEQPPVVVETFPVSGTRDVEPGVAEIRVRFSKEMADGGWSWSTAWQNSTPETVGQVHYEPDQRTCVLKAKLEPGRTYAWWLNSEKFHKFTDQAGRAAVPYLLIFQTKPN
jgi:ribosomal protein L29